MRAVPVLLAAALLACGCECRIEMVVEPPGSAPLDLRLSGTGFPCGREARVASLEVLRARSGETLWLVESRDGRAVPLERVVYGRVPDGFLERVPDRPLSAGEKVRVVATAPGWVGQVEATAGPPPRGEAGARP